MNRIDIPNIGTFSLGFSKGWKNHFLFLGFSKKAELPGLVGVLREFHESLFGEVEQCRNGGGGAALLQRLDNFCKQSAAVDAVDFGAVKVAGRQPARRKNQEG